MKNLILLLSAGLACGAQNIDTVAGTQEPGFSGDGGRAVRAMITDPRSLALDRAGNLFLVDYDANRVRKVATDGTISTVAGNGEAGSPSAGPAQQSSFVMIYGISAGADGQLYVASTDGLHAIDAQGRLQDKITGQSVPVMDAASGSILVSDFTRVMKWQTDGTFETLAGGEAGDTGDGGPATAARLYPGALATDRLGRIWVADPAAHRVRRFVPGGDIVTVAGNGAAGFSGDGGSGANAQLDTPTSIAVDVAGNLYIADSHNLRVRRVRTDGVIETVAGSGEWGASGDGEAATRASFTKVSHVAVNCQGLYISDATRVRMVRLPEPLLAMQGIADAETGAFEIRPGKRFTITGCNLSDGFASVAPGASLPTLLGGVSVSVNGVPAGIAAVGPGQVDAVLPAGTVFPGEATMTVYVGTKALTARVMVR